MMTHVTVDRVLRSSFFPRARNDFIVVCPTMSHDDFDRRYLFCICVSERKGDARPLYQLRVWNADLRVHDDDPGKNRNHEPGRP